MSTKDTFAILQPLRPDQANSGASIIKTMMPLSCFIFLNFLSKYQTAGNIHSLNSCSDPNLTLQQISMLQVVLASESEI